MCSSMPAMAAVSKHTVAHTRSYLHLRTQPDSHKTSDVETCRPSEKIPHLAIPPECYTVSQAQGRDTTFLGKTSFKNQVHEGDIDNIGFALLERAADTGGIVQSLEVDVSVSPNLVRGGEGGVVPWEQMPQPSDFPRVACHDDQVGLLKRSYEREDV